MNPQINILISETLSFTNSIDYRIYEDDTGNEIEFQERINIEFGGIYLDFWIQTKQDDFGELEHLVIALRSAMNEAIIKLNEAKKQGTFNKKFTIFELNQKLHKLKSYNFLYNINVFDAGINSYSLPAIWFKNNLKKYKPEILEVFKEWYDYRINFFSEFLEVEGNSLTSTIPEPPKQQETAPTGNTTTDQDSTEVNADNLTHYERGLICYYNKWIVTSINAKTIFKEKKLITTDYGTGKVAETEYNKAKNERLKFTTLSTATNQKKRFEKIEPYILDQYKQDYLQDLEELKQLIKELENK